MASVSDKIEYLNRLLSARKRQEQEAIEVSTEAQKPRADPRERPDCLAGLSTAEILLLEVDGGLPREAQRWLKTRNIPGRMPPLVFDD